MPEVINLHDINEMLKLLKGEYPVRHIRRSQYDPPEFDVPTEIYVVLNEYVYQEALKVSLEEKEIPFEKEHYFQVSYHGHPLSHKHYMDFLCKGNIVVECKAIAALGTEQRQQLWNYMRLTNTPTGVLFNFAPFKDQCEKYYYDVNTKTIAAF